MALTYSGTNYGCIIKTSSDGETAWPWCFAYSRLHAPDDVCIVDSLDDLMRVMQMIPGFWYVHNLQLYSAMLFTWLFKRGFELKFKDPDAEPDEKLVLEPGQFSTLVPRDNNIYNIQICFPNNNTINIINSKHIYTSDIDDIGKMVNIKTDSTLTDSLQFVSRGYQPTEKERRAITAECAALSAALRVVTEKEHNIGGTSIKTGFGGCYTVAGMAMKDFKRDYTKGEFASFFPELQKGQEAFIRRSYAGGYNYMRDDYNSIPPLQSLYPKGSNTSYVDHIFRLAEWRKIEREKARTHYKVIRVDITSFYPFIMDDYPLPYGHPKPFNGKYVSDIDYPFFFQEFSCEFKVKEGKLPFVCINDPKSPLAYGRNLAHSAGHDAHFVMTRYDLELFFEHYDVYNIDYTGGLKFQQHKGFFSDYIHRWYTVKNALKDGGNRALYIFAKYMLNSLYGKFGVNRETMNLAPYLNDDGIIAYVPAPRQEVPPGYLPIASAITSIGRYHMIHTAQLYKDRLLYCDTDSMDLEGYEIPYCVAPEGRDMGEWRVQAYIRRAKYLALKTYVFEAYENERPYGKYNLEITAAGMPARCKRGVKFDDIEHGNQLAGMYAYQNVKGGTHVYNSMFTLP